MCKAASQHNELRDLTASLLTKVCHNAVTEPRLQPLSGESLSHRTAQPLPLTMPEGSGLLLKTHFLMQPECTQQQLQNHQKKHEDENKRAYGQRVRDIEQGPLVFSTTGGLAATF